MPPAPAQATAEARARRLEAIKQTNDFLATRVPFDAPGFVAFMHKTLAAMPREQAKVRKIPYFDDLLWLVSTSVALHEMDEAALRQHVRDTLREPRLVPDERDTWPLGHAVDTLSALAAKLDAAALAQRSRRAHGKPRWRRGGARRRAASPALRRTIAAAGTALDTLLPRLAALDTNLFDGQVDAATRTMQRLPLELDRQMRRVVQAVGPSQQLGLYATMGAELKASLELAAPAALAAEIETMLAGAIDALQSFDLGPLGEVSARRSTRSTRRSARSIPCSRALPRRYRSPSTRWMESSPRSIRRRCGEGESGGQGVRRRPRGESERLFAPVKTAIAARRWTRSRRRSRASTRRISSTRSRTPSRSSPTRSTRRR